MSFMQEQILSKMSGWEIETLEGTTYIPGDIVPVPYWLKADETIRYSQDGIFNTLMDSLYDFIPCPDKTETITAIENRYFARMSAPGYLDCTEWCAFKTLQEAQDYLQEAYGEDDEDAA